MVDLNSKLSQNQLFDLELALLEDDLKTARQNVRDILLDIKLLKRRRDVFNLHLGTDLRIEKKEN